MDCKEFIAKLMKDDEQGERTRRFWAQLYYRYQDEKGHEAIEEYMVPVAKTYPNVIKAHKRPFGFTFQCDDGRVRAEIRSKGRGLEFTYRRVV